jgi:hypothetical protein
VDDDGRIWVWLFMPSVRGTTTDAAGASRAAWTEPVSAHDVYAPTGDFLGSVQFPQRATFAAAKGDKLWLVVKDSLDVPRVVRYLMSGLRE